MKKERILELQKLEKTKKKPEIKREKPNIKFGRKNEKPQITL